MIIVINLLRNIFIIMFFILMILEILVLLGLAFSYSTPLSTSVDSINKEVGQNSQMIINSFSEFFTRKYSNIATDLLMIGKHIYPMYLTLNPTSSNPYKYPTYKTSSRFYNSYYNKDCLKAGVNSYANDLYKVILQSNNNFDKQNENDIINTIFADPNINFISYFQDPNWQAINFSSDQKTIICYTISMLKTLFTRNIIFDRTNQLVQRFLLIMQGNPNNYLFHYPPFSITNQSLNSIPNYDPLSRYYFTSAQTFIDGISKSTYRSNQIFYDQPIFINNTYSQKGCISVTLTESLNNLACIELNLGNLTSYQDIMSSTDTVNLYLAYISNNEINIYFNNQVNISSMNRTIFKNSAKNLNDPNQPITLFHGFYYNIYNYTDFKPVTDEKAILNEYNNLRDAIITKIYKYSFGVDYCKALQNYSLNIITDKNYSAYKLSFLDSEYNLFSYNQSFSVNTDIFTVLVQPIVLNYSNFDPSAYVFQNTCTPFNISYSIILVRNGQNTIPDKIRNILYLKSIRSCFFFISLLVFAMMIYFILCEIYVKFLIVPIKYIRIKLERLIKGKSENEEKETKTNEVETFYRNKETKKLEEMVNNLQKIITMKNAQGKPDFKEKSKIYKKFLEDTGNKDDKEHKKQCYLIIAYSFYKDNDFVKSEKFLKKLINLTEQEEDEILSKNDSFEQKLINHQPTSGNIPYYNDFTDNDIQDPELNKFAKLKLLNQRIFYFYGFLKYSEYKKLKKENRGDEIGGLTIAKKMLQKSLKINVSMHYNQIKCIFIQILLAKCAYLIEEYTEASNNLRDALIDFTELNKNFLEKKINEKIDPRVMFIINGVIMEQILYNIGKICVKVGKKKLAAIVFNKLLEITYFRSEKIQKKACQKLYSILFEDNENRESKDKNKSIEDKMNNSEYNVSKQLLKKMINRFQGEPKSLLILISYTLLEKFSSKYELKEVLLKGIEKTMNKEDFIKISQFDSDFDHIVETNTVESNLGEIKKNENFCKVKNKEKVSDIPSKKTFYKIIKSSILGMKDEDAPQDKYIFLFVYDQDFKFNDKKQAKEILDLLKSEFITLYLFIFNDFKKPEREVKVANFMGELMEGYLILVKNFQIIEESFENISPSTRKNNDEAEYRDGKENCFAHNILDSNFENHKNIK